MGQTQTKRYYIPTTKNFKLSYRIQENVPQCEILKKINLSKLVEEYKSVNLVSQLLYYKCNHQGYSFKEYPVSTLSYRLDHIFEYISEKGIFLNGNAIISDLSINYTCYYSNLNNIYYFLNKGSILVGGIILNKKFINEVLQMDSNNQDIMSDIILIVGYDTDSIYLKTNWCENIVKMDNSFINNIKELWNVEIKTFY
jgi:hypothetical protein